MSPRNDKIKNEKLNYRCCKQSQQNRFYRSHQLIVYDKNTDKRSYNPRGVLCRYNQYMTTILENQYIAKRRRKPSSSRNKPTYKSASFYSGFMNEYKQKPSHVKSEKTRTDRTHSDKTRSDRTGNEQKKSGFSFPLPSIATIALIAGTIVIAFAALNWQNINLDIPDIYAFKPIEGSESGELIIDYASTGNPILQIGKTETKTEKKEPAATAKNEPEENFHGIPIPFEWHYHTVKKNEAVSKIAEIYKVSVGAIVAANDIKNVRRIQTGEVLRVPNVDGIPHKVKAGDSLLKISTNYNVPLDVILDINDIKSDIIKPGETIFIPGARMNDIDLKKSLGELFMYPLQSRFITSYYGMRKDPKNGTLQFHAGVDFRGKIGTPVMASLDGVVSVVSDDWLYGKFIIINHYNGYKTLYGHLNAYSVKEGDKVARGKKIGEVGNTGYSTGPHLHFGVFDKNGKLVNPLDLLN